MIYFTYRAKIAADASKQIMREKAIKADLTGDFLSPEMVRDIFDKARLNREEITAAMLAYLQTTKVGCNLATCL